ncbi:MAG: 3-deoxy-7-phosphoheptulonate synthase [Kiritimatiellae bacterium]|nr:3-deoxy-7-phosphoheptulonate synthase [Kiritimatiellia bacterium]
MIIVLKRHASETDIQTVSDMVSSMRYQPRIIRGVEQTVIAGIGDELSNRSLEVLKNLPAVESVFAVQKKFKLVSRTYHAPDTVVNVGGTLIGGGTIPVLAGPCSIESYDQFRASVQDLVALGVTIVRAMPFKPRTSPYDFQGLKYDGIKIMREVKSEFKVAFVSEVMGTQQIEMLSEVADMYQVGARNGQNYDLLEHLARAGKPVLLKRGMAETVEEWLSSAEYLLVNGCQQVVLCERGLRSFDTVTRNILDVGGIAAARQLTHLPVIADPSHAAGKRSLVLPLAKAALAAGADGLEVETHPDPVGAFSDASQQIPTVEFKAFLDALAPWLELARRERSSAAEAE